jgi:hypothetical protein
MTRVALVWKGVWVIFEGGVEEALSAMGSKVTMRQVLLPQGLKTRVLLLLLPQVPLPGHESLSLIATICVSRCLQYLNFLWH